MPKRILIAGLFHETNTFVDQTTGLSDFQILQGEQLLRCAGDSSPLGGVLEAAKQFDWTVLPTVDYRASPGGMVEDEVIETFWREFRHFAEPQFAEGVDAIYLVLHGAMVSRSIPDVEGEILRWIRQTPRLAELPIFGVFDLHANFTQRMADHSNGLVAYRENPHTDARQAAQLGAALLQRSLETGKIPTTYWAHPPMVWPPTGTSTATEPMLSLENLARTIEAECEDIWAVNVMAGFSFADIPATGVSFSIVTIGSESEARARLAQLCELALQNKEKGNVLELPIEALMPHIVSLNSVAAEVTRLISSIPQSERRDPEWRATSDRLPEADKEKTDNPGLIVLVEPSDNIGAGAPGDGTGVLRALIRHNINNSAVAINDPEAVRSIGSLPIGTDVTLSIGGKGSTLDLGPIELRVQLISRSDGQFQLEDRQSHLASMAGDSFDMGPCAVVRHAGVLILLTSRRTPPFDLGQWRSQGIDPEKLSVIGVKAAVAHRRAYDPIAARMFWVDTPGPCSSNLKLLPYRRVLRPIYPLDDLSKPNGFR